MDFIILTGMSGAGITTATEMLEDMGYFCVNNVPPRMLLKFAQLNDSSHGYAEKMVLIVDARSKEEFLNVGDELKKLKDSGFDFKLLFIDANDNTLLKRYKEKRRVHPMMQDNNTPSLSNAIKYERKILIPVKAKADFLIDTSMTRALQLQNIIEDLFGTSKDCSMAVQVMSFGYKYGIPLEADLVIDVRCLPNPYYIKELKKQTGTDKPVSDYVMGFEVSQQFLRKLERWLMYLYPLYVEEGKKRLVIAIGCTGGMHRSVTIVEELYKYMLSEKLCISKSHRDKDRPDQLMK